MRKYYSPLRYPGGKGVLGEFLKTILLYNNLENYSYFEPYAGGAGAALYLLFDDIVKDIHLNDLDSAIYSFWWAILHETERFIRLVNDTEVTVDQWHTQRQILDNEKDDMLAIGFALFYLNRTNRSGIILNAGPIGGYEQDGRWLIDARYNKAELISRIKNIARVKNKIFISNMDGQRFVQQKVENAENNAFVFFDPPYYKKGKTLYLAFEQDHHMQLAGMVKSLRIPWIMTYDNSQEIIDLYKSEFSIYEYGLNYSLQTKKKAKEILLRSSGIVIPKFYYQAYNQLKI